MSIKNIAVTKGFDGDARVLLDLKQKAVILNVTNGSVRLDADGILVLMNAFLRCLPELMLLNNKETALGKGLPVAKSELKAWHNDLNKRKKNMSERRWLSVFFNSLTQTASDDALQHILNLCRSEIAKGAVHYQILLQQLRNASVQLHQNSDNAIGEEYEETNHFGTVSRAPVVDINQFASSEDRTKIE